MEHHQRLGASPPPSAAEVAIGLVEAESIAKGYEATDAIMKVAPVRVLWARTVSPGRFVTLFTGDVEACTIALRRGSEVAADALVDDVLIPQAHAALLEAVRGPRKVDVDALGVVETATVATALVAADAAAKATAAELLEVRLAMHLGGKGFFSITGEVGDVEESVAVGAELARARGALVREVVIARASPELLEHLF